ncbi:MAG: hypothetical protein ACOYYS_01765 [Chloroflexota bacterium]
MLQKNVLAGPGWKLLAGQIRRSFLGYVHLPLGSIYTLHQPLLRFPASIFFCLGVSALVARLRDTRTLLLILWLSAFGLIGGLSEGSPAGQRMVAVIPAAAILFGHGLSEAVRCFEAAKLGNRFRRFGVVLALVIVLLIGVMETIRKLYPGGKVSIESYRSEVLFLWYEAP